MASGDGKLPFLSKTDGSPELPVTKFLSGRGWSSLGWCCKYILVATLAAVLGARELCNYDGSLSVIGTIYWCGRDAQEVWVGLQHFRPVLEAPWERFPFYTDGKKKMNVFWQERHVFSVLPFKCSNDTGWAWGEVIRLSLLLFQLKRDNSGLQSSCGWWEWVEEVLGWMRSSPFLLGLNTTRQEATSVVFCFPESPERPKSRQGELKEDWWVEIQTRNGGTTGREAKSWREGWGMGHSPAGWVWGKEWRLALANALWL